jgi:hypothetical protein
MLFMMAGLPRPVNFMQEGGAINLLGLRQSSKHARMPCEHLTSPRGYQQANAEVALAYDKL